MSRVTKEEKVAEKLIELMSDIRLDLDLIGMYLAKVANKSFFLRAERVFQSSEETLTVDVRENHYERLGQW